MPDDKMAENGACPSGVQWAGDPPEEDSIIVELSARDMAAFIAMAENPPKPNEAVIKAAKEHREKYGRSADRRTRTKS